MLHTMLRFFGLTPVQPVKRPPTKRKAKPAAKLAIESTHTIADDHPRALTYEERQAAKAGATVTTLGAACRVYARLVGEFGSKPNEYEVAYASRILGSGGWAYFQARTLHGRRSLQMGVDQVGDQVAEAALHFRIAEGMKDLDLWEGLANLEKAAAKEARSRGQKPSPAIVIPPGILKLLDEREKLRLARIEKGGAKGKGGVRLTPSEPAAPEKSADPTLVTEAAPVDPAGPALTDPTPGESDPSTQRKP